MWSDVGWKVAVLLVPLAAFLTGLFVAPHFGPARRGWLIGGALTLLPPAIWLALYRAASGTGCSGGDCAGAIIFMLLLAVPFALAALLGVGVLLRTLIGSVVRAVSA
ncbi:hypothetical protein [Sphingomonas jatrophae]|uniref:Uncharacterized protein n=1 Tax=Sphingomonas jatrophae TaxID=1166337 RepID=A0A1I6LRD1_9SPHN|nr:hypothetical protein [Sphingomonas jatrophae]SFS05850.1 hypothetical protein SAMN05192580_3148 [Sphingomonas jatrophae]